MTRVRVSDNDFVHSAGVVHCTEAPERAWTHYWRALRMSGRRPWSDMPAGTNSEAKPAAPAKPIFGSDDATSFTAPRPHVCCWRRLFRGRSPAWQLLPGLSVRAHSGWQCIRGQSDSHCGTGSQQQHGSPARVVTVEDVAVLSRQHVCGRVHPGH